MNRKKILVSISIAALILLPSVGAVAEELYDKSDTGNDFIYQFLPIGIKKVRILFKNFEGQPLEGYAKIIINRTNQENKIEYNYSLTLNPGGNTQLVTLRTPLISLFYTGKIAVQLFIENSIPQWASGFIIMGFIVIKYVSF